MPILYLKALHLIFVVTWFAGLFYIVRLFIYHVEAQSRSEDERDILQSQYKVMERRLWYGITWPSMVGSLIFGFWLAHDMGLLSSPWLHVKLALVGGLVLYHLQCGRIFKQLAKDEITLTANFLRIWNEVATLFLVSIVFLAVLKNTVSWIWGLVGFLTFALLLLLAIRIYKRVREK
ncbi:MAG: CopD family protein [Flavobacteriales bacterium]|nr:CopD family protein [Flavobacteriales bacterium]